MNKDDHIALNEACKTHAALECPSCSDAQSAPVWVRSSAPTMNGLRLVGFAVVHLAIVGASVAWATARFAHHSSLRQLPQVREEPLRVEPRFDRPEMISERQLVAVLSKLKPRLTGPNPKINHVDHALRFWGVEAQFDDPDCLSGMQMRELLADHRRFSESWKRGTKPFLRRSAEGVTPLVQRGPATSSHYDHTLATLAEVGTPLDYPLILPEGETTMRDMLLYSLRKFSLNQQEYEWSALAFAHYLLPNDGWITTEGQHITFDRIAERMMRERLTDGVCFGNHRLHALTMLLRVDEQNQILSGEGRAAILTHLRNVTDLLVTTQHESGYWDRNWDGIPRKDVPGPMAPLSKKILATGHALEWWALAPEELHPPREVLVHAADWLVHEILKMSDSQIRTNYTFLSHAGRALTLWRGRFPAEVRLPSGL